MPARKLLRPYRALLKSYGRQAKYYDRLWRRYSEPTVRATAEAVPWCETRRLLDVGCGTGLLEREAAGRATGLQIIGIDLTMPMLRQAQRKFPSSDAPAWVNAGAEQLPLASGIFDAVICANSLHYFRQPQEALEEFHRVLRPGRWLVLEDWCHDYLACRICHWVLRAVDRAYARMYGIEECRRMLEAAGFQVEVARRFKIDWLWGLMLFRARAR